MAVISRFTESQLEDVFQKLISSDNDLKNYYDGYLIEEYKDDPERNCYYDIARIADVIQGKYRSGNTENFGILFGNIEEILASCDHYVLELIVIGLFEDIQNDDTEKVDYHSGFDKWLRPLSKKEWDERIDFWEGTSWRNKK